jgi:hypothetical protein
MPVTTPCVAVFAGWIRLYRPSQVHMLCGYCVPICSFGHAALLERRDEVKLMVLEAKTSGTENGGGSETSSS